MDFSLISFFLPPEAPPKAEIQRVLKPYGFKNPSKIWKELSALSQNAFDREAWAECLPLMLPEFSEAPDPDLAVTQFADYAEKSFHRSQLYQYLARVPQARKVLAKILGFSPYLASILNQEPGLLYWLLDEDGLYARFSKERQVETLERETGAIDDFEGKLNASRRVKRRQMLRLGGRDLLGLCDVKSLTLELSGLADALLETVLEAGKGKLAKSGIPEPDGRFVVIGMGKLGGNELNYCSDVDLLFIYETSPLSKVQGEEARKYYNELAEWIIHSMQDSSSLGNLFKVDMRLRPEGLGDMAKSLDAYLEHYESRSQLWELQALIKARPCAGDLDLGRQFLKDMEPLIFRKSFDSQMLREMREVMVLIKKKMEGMGRQKTQVKLGKGGIREIEYIVQLFQLAHGGLKPQIREANTLEALEKLALEGLLLKADAQFLAESYRFLRNAEHHLQMVQGLQTHTLPRKIEDLRSLARSLGFKGDPEEVTRLFRAHYSDLTSRVNHLYQEAFQIKTRTDVSSLVVQASLADDREELERLLEGKLFFDPSQAASNLLALARRLKRSTGTKGEILWAGFVPEVFKGLAKIPHPDRALNQLESFLNATSLPDLYIRYLLGNHLMLHLLLELFSNSLFLSQVLIAHPGNFDIVQRAINERAPRAVQDLQENLEDRMSQAQDWEGRLSLLREIRDGEALRVGLQDLLGRRELFDCFAELSRLAVAVSRSALGASADKLGFPCSTQRPCAPKGFCVMGMGKLGAREMNYGSDLDVLFIYSDEDAREHGFENYLKLSETFTTALAAPTPQGIAYQVDARLRPMGREAQMVHSVGAYRDYFRNHAMAAERLAYTRCSFLAGDLKTAAEAEKEIALFTYGRGLRRKEWEEILDIRGQMEQKAKKSKGLEIKVSPGGISDIEFFTQTLQVALGHDHPRIRAPHLPTALARLKEERLVPLEVLEELLEAYGFFRLLEARHRMVRETSDDELPEEPERLLRLAWRTGLGRGKEAAGHLVERVEKTQERVRGLFKRLPEWIRFED